jgi:hypothetical protein
LGFGSEWGGYCHISHYFVALPATNYCLNASPNNGRAAWRLLFATGLLFVATGFFALRPEKELGQIQFTGYSNLVTRSATGRMLTNHFAVFSLVNDGAKPLNYAGTPAPIYNILTLEQGSWRLQDDPVRVDDFVSLLPGERLDFRVYIPASAHYWSIAIPCMRPAKIPYPFRQFFKPAFYTLQSAAVRPFSGLGRNPAAAPNPAEPKSAGERLTK